MALDDDLRRLAALQHSVIARRQARALGASASALRHRVRGPDWEAMTPAVLGFTDTEVWYHGDKVVAELRRARTGHRKPRPSA